MDLYILRHAIAEDRDKSSGKPDSQRRLTPEGVEKMRRVAEGMKSLGLEFDLILSSPFLRAKETAEIVADVLALGRRLEMSADLSTSGNPKNLIESLNGPYADRKSVVLVGHEPYLSSFISLLLSGGTNIAINFKKGGLCKLTVEHLKYGRCAALEWLLTPKQLRAMRKG
jgi:phosphohistidine phosphatase